MGDVMSDIQRFIKAVTLLILLTVLAVLNSEVPYICILIAGILMVVLCERSLSDEENKWLTVLQWILSAIFAVISGTYFSYLIFYECKFEKNKKVELVFPAGLYGITEFVMQKYITPQIIYHAIILLGLTTIIYVLEELVVRYMSAKKQILHAVRITAVNELYAKKLNQELVIKNYLVDKNARLEEREKISRNIHNSVGHSITAAIMTLDAADMLFGTAPDKAREKMNAANERIRASLGSIRQAVRVLDKENEFVSMEDFVGEILAVADSFVMDTMITIHTDFQRVDGAIQLPHAHTEFLAGAVQELLTNGVRHGKADLFTIMLDADSGHIKLSVKDNGKSDFSIENQADRIQNGFGLKKLISYVKKCGGEIAFFNDSGFKTEITLNILREE